LDRRNKETSGICISQFKKKLIGRKKSYDKKSCKRIMWYFWLSMHWQVSHHKLLYYNRE